MRERCKRIVLPTVLLAGVVLACSGTALAGKWSIHVRGHVPSYSTTYVYRPHHRVVHYGDVYGYHPYPYGIGCYAVPPVVRVYRPPVVVVRPPVGFYYAPRPRLHVHVW